MSGTFDEIFISHTLILILATTVTLGGLAVVVWVATQVLRHATLRARFLASILLLVYGAAFIFKLSAWPVIDIAVLMGAIGATVLIGGSFSSSGAVVAMLVAAAAVDIFSVSGGLTRVIIEGYREGTNDLLLYLSLVVPIDGHTIPIVGISDLFLGGSAAVALIRLGSRPVAVIGAIAISLVGALVYGIWRGGVAALPFIAVAILFVVWRNSVSSTRHQTGASTP